MIVHASIPVSDLCKNADFYTKILDPLGLSPLVKCPATRGIGKHYPKFWLNGGGCDGRPGDSQGTMTNYIGAFILEPDGNRIEAVTFPS